MKLTSKGKDSTTVGYSEDPLWQDIQDTLIKEGRSMVGDTQESRPKFNFSHNKMAIQRKEKIYKLDSKIFKNQKNKNIRLQDPTKDPYIPNMASMDQSKNASDFATYVKQATLQQNVQFKNQKINRNSNLQFSTL